MTNGSVQKIVVGVATTLLTAAILAGASGLITAHNTKADVDKLQKDIAEQQRVTVEIQKSVSAIEKTLELSAEADKQLRDEYREDQRELKELIREAIR